jgi:phosphoglycolate phosphatase-like HAD superfamily hydrolase
MDEQGPALLPVRFLGERGATGPLTFGQRNTLNWVGNEADRYSAVVQWRLSLPAGAGLADVQAAFSVLLARHEALRTSYPTDAPVAEATQRVARSGELVIEVHELAAHEAGLDEEGLTDLLVARLRAQGIDYTADLPLRVAVATRGGVPTLAVVVYSHMAIDFASMALIGRQFTELAADPAAREPGPLGHQPLGHQPLDQAAVERSAHGQRQAEAALRYWDRHLRTAPQSMFPVPAPLRPGPGFRTALLHSPAAGLALGQVSARTRAGRQAVLLAAICAALSRRTGIGRCVFVAISSNRFRTRLRGYVGSLAQDGLMAVGTDGGRFDDLVRRAGQATLAASTHSMFDATRLWQVINDIGETRGTAFTRDFTLNNVSAHLDGEPSVQPPGDPAEVAAALPRTTLRWADSVDYPVVLMCNPVRLDPELLLALTADLRLVAAADVEALLSGVERLLVAAATEDLPPDRIGPVSGIEAVVRGPGWVLVDSCWVDLAAVRGLLADALAVPAVHAALAADGTLVGYAAAGDRSPEQAHGACMALLRAGGRHTAMAPGRYVLCDGAPAEPADGAAWQARPVLATGPGRRPTPGTP